MTDQSKENPLFYSLLVLFALGVAYLALRSGEPAQPAMPGVKVPAPRIFVAPPVKEALAAPAPSVAPAEAAPAEKTVPATVEMPAETNPAPAGGWN